MSAEAVYDFETILPNAIKELFTARGLTALTISDAPEFQKVRPRVEIAFSVKGEASPKRLAILQDGSKRTSCYRGELRLQCITEADEQGKTYHSQYRAAVRDVVGSMESELNGTYLENHSVNFIASGNEDTGIRSSDDYQETRFLFVVDISIQQDAWALL